MQEGCGNYSEAARLLSKKFSKTITPGFVLSRLKRAGITKEALQTVGLKISDLQIQKTDNETNIAKQVVC